MTRKTIALLFGLLLGALCLGVVVAKNPRFRASLAQASATEVDPDQAHPHPHPSSDEQDHAHGADTGHEGDPGVAPVEPAGADVHAHLPEDDGHAHPPSPANDQQSQAAPDEHDHEPGVVHLEAQRIAELGIEVVAVTSGEVKAYARLSGEIKLNTDQVAHIVPQVSGIVRRVLKTVGDRVEPGEVIAWLESAKLGDTKVQYLAKLAETTCCALELTRAQQVHDGTMRLLTELESRPALEALTDTKGASMGKNLSQLVPAYAEWVLAEKTYRREKALNEQQITSQGEFLAAENALKKAEAVYHATRDSVAYDVQHELLEAQRVQRIRQIELTSAERRLYVLGLTARDIHRLEQMDQQSNATGDCDDPNCPQCRQVTQEKVAAVVAEADHECDDPNCQDCVEHLHAETGHECDDPNCQDCVDHVHRETAAELPEAGSYEQRLAWHPLRAPFAGTIISKHLSMGEFVKDDSDVFVIANLDTVWVDFQVHQKDLPLVREGQTIQMQIGSGLGTVAGEIAYVSPIVDVATRTAWARIVLPNTGRRLRPGLFVTGAVAVDRTQTPIAVTDSAIQYIEDKPCVFVYEDEHFEKRDVALGRADSEWVEILSGLKRGEIVAAQGSFHIKAEIEKQLTGAGGGHGHAH